MLKTFLRTEDSYPGNVYFRKCNSKFRVFQMWFQMHKTELNAIKAEEVNNSSITK
jgi:hypothetical protein